MINVEAVVVAALREAGVCGGRVHVTMPPGVGYPAGRVTRIGGGLSTPPWIDRALLQIEFWGDDTGEAFDQCAAAIAVLGGLRGTVPTGVVANTTVDSVQNFPDDTFQPARPRRIITATVTTHPTRTTH